METKFTYKLAYYHPSTHFQQRYKERMSEHIGSKVTSNRLLNANETELAKRANYMLLFSIHGRKGDSPHTEVRYYFEWDIVIDNKDQTLITMYINDKRKIPPVRLFGNRQVRKKVYNDWFKPKRKGGLVL